MELSDDEITQILEAEDKRCRVRPCTTAAIGLLTYLMSKLCGQHLAWYFNVAHACFYKTLQ